MTAMNSTRTARARHDGREEREESARMSDRDGRPRAAVRRWTIGDVAEEVLGDRFGGVFVEGDRVENDRPVTWVVKAVARTDEDHAAIRAEVQRRGIAGSFRVEDAGRSLRDLTELTADVSEHLRLARGRFPFGLGPDIHREVVELEMGASAKNAGSLLSWRWPFRAGAWSSR
jgi:hypothetical protein